MKKGYSSHGCCIFSNRALHLIYVVVSCIKIALVLIFLQKDNDFSLNIPKFVPQKNNYTL